MAIDRTTSPPQPNKLRWSEIDEEDGVDLDFFLPPPQVIGPDENGIKKVVEYKFDEQGNRTKVTTTTRVRKLTSARFSKRAVQRRSWAKFGDAVHEDVGSRLTMISTEEIVLERHRVPGGKAEHANTSGDSLAQIGKGAVLMVCRNCGKKGDHWTAKCPFKDLAPQAEVGSMDRPPSADGTAASSLANNSTYVPPSRRGGAERSVGSDMKRRNDENAVRIGNLSEDTQDSDLVELCSSFGQVLRAHVPKDYNTGLSRGYGFVNFLYKEDAERAVSKLNGYGYDNLILKVEWSAPRTN